MSTAATIDLTTFDATRAMTLRQAIDTGRLTFRGRKPTLVLVQRWANPRRGCKPLGPGSDAIVLPTVLTGRERLTMPEWVDWFVRERSLRLIQAARAAAELVAPPTPAKLAKRDERATKRLRELGVNC